MTMEPKIRPVETFRDSKLKASVWRNEGKEGPYYTVTLAKTYEDRNGRLQDSHSFTGGELLRVAELAREAHSFVRDIKREHSLDRKNHQQEPQHDITHRR